MQLNIDLLTFKKELLFRNNPKKQDAKDRFIFCQIRKKYLALGPEELVRQLMISYLIQDRNYNKNRIAVEREFIINERKKRCDILVFDSAMKPHILVECKAPEVPLNQATFRQVAWYNMPLKVDYLIVTNGLKTFCCKINYIKEDFEFIGEIPNS